MDHVWAMGIILAYVLCNYPALKGMEDIHCYNNLGIGQEVQSGERERLQQDGHTFPAKEWNIVHWLHLYKKHWKSPEDLEEYNN
eukprot:jgi/Psemu1/23154/gm1.23154_g